jgi:hypothetical protein
VAEEVAEEVSTAVVLEAEVSMGEVSVVGSTAAVLAPALWLPDTLEAESAAAAAESALGDRTCQVVFRILPAQGLGSPHLGNRHPGNRYMMDGLIDQ